MDFPFKICSNQTLFSSKQFNQVDLISGQTDPLVNCGQLPSFSLHSDWLFNEDFIAFLLRLSGLFFFDPLEKELRQIKGLGLCQRLSLKGPVEDSFFPSEPSKHSGFVLLSFHFEIQFYSKRIERNQNKEAQFQFQIYFWLETSFFSFEIRSWKLFWTSWGISRGNPMSDSLEVSFHLNKDILWVSSSQMKITMEFFESFWFLKWTNTAFLDGFPKLSKPRHPASLGFHPSTQMA